MSAEDPAAVWRHRCETRRRCAQYRLRKAKKGAGDGAERVAEQAGGRRRGRDRPARDGARRGATVRDGELASRTSGRAAEADDRHGRPRAPAGRARAARRRAGRAADGCRSSAAGTAAHPSRADAPVSCAETQLGSHVAAHDRARCRAGRNAAVGRAAAPAAVFGTAAAGRVERPDRTRQPRLARHSYAGTRTRSARRTISNETGVVPTCSPSSSIGRCSGASTRTRAVRRSSTRGCVRWVPR